MYRVEINVTRETYDSARNLETEDHLTVVAYDVREDEAMRTAVAAATAVTGPAVVTVGGDR